MSKPAAVIDKSLLQAICEQDSEKRNADCEALCGRYQLVVASVLVEELWVNFAVGPRAKSSAILENMKQFLIQRKASWIAEPSEISFIELVKRKPVNPLPRPPRNLVHSFFILSPSDPKLVAWAKERRSGTEAIIRSRVKEYAGIFGTERFAPMKNGLEFFELIRTKFVEMVSDSTRKRELLEGVLGIIFRAEHPECSREIDRAFDSYSADTFDKYQATLNFIVAAMFYRYAPLCKIVSGSGGSKAAVKILGRGYGDLFNNLADERYVQSALLCDRLLTRDRGMHNVMKLLKECGFWDGIPIFIDPKKDLESQISQNLV